MFPLHDDNPTVITPYITYLLIIVCVVAFFWELSLAGQLEGVFYSLLAEQHAVSPDFWK